MTILLELERRAYTSLQDELTARRDACLLALNQYLRGYFEPMSLEIWENAPLEELGGDRLDSIDVNIGSILELRKLITEKVKNMKTNQLANTIIRIYGIWKLRNLEQKGFFSINNGSKWRKAYGDIDVDVISGEEDDITKLMWNDEDRNILVNEFFKNYLRDYRTNELDKKMFLTWICFSSSIPSRKDITTIKAVYYSELKQFIKDAFETYKESYDWVQRSLRLQYIVNKLYAHKEFHQIIKRKLEDFRINQISGNSVILIGENLNSFHNLYEDFSSKYFYKIFKELPTDKKVNEVLTKVITGQKTVSDFS